METPFVNTFSLFQQQVNYEELQNFWWLTYRAATAAKDWISYPVPARRL